MKSKIIFLLLIIASVMTFGQDKGITLEEVQVTPPKFTGIEQISSPISKYEGINAFIRSNVQYPESAQLYKQQGTVVVQFTVNTNGQLSEYKIINSVSDNLDHEVIRLLKTTDGKWSPGSNNGRLVAMEKEVSVVFKLDFSSDSDIQYTNNFEEFAKKSYLKGNEKLFTKNRPRAALRSYNESMRFKPLSPATLIVRALCKYKIGDIAGANSDYDRLNKLTSSDQTYFSGNLEQYVGYNELVALLNK